MPSRIDILIERAKRRAAQESSPNTSQGAATSGDQVEYLVRSGLLNRCEDCRKVIEPGVTYTHRGGRKTCEDCYAAAADFQDTAPGYAP
jgi:pyoverdine/dityrosine biosynthesis protein Dit1